MSEDTPNSTPAPMSAGEYQSLALRTLCPDEGIDINRVHWGTLRSTLLAICHHTQVLDAIKAAVCYNKPFPSMYNQESKGAPRPADIDPQVLHAIIGIVSEAGEMAADLNRFLFEGGDLDVKNIKAESGDIDWFQALLDSRIDYTQEERWADNIVKLEKRYTRTSEEVTFTAEDALDRDTTAEVDHIKDGVEPPRGQLGPVGQTGPTHPMTVDGGESASEEEEEHEPTEAGVRDFDATAEATEREIKAEQAEVVSGVDYASDDGDETVVSEAEVTDEGKSESAESSEDPSSTDAADASDEDEDPDKP